MTTGKRTIRLAGPPTFGSFVSFEIVYAFAYHFGMGFADNFAAPMWFPDSVLLCTLLVSPSGSWWLYILGTAPIRLFLSVSPDSQLWFLAACFVNDSLK